jgi:hypothetical protein
MMKQSKFVKIRTAVPVDNANQVRQVMGDAGAGKQGNYSHCSGSYLSTGRFTPLKGANPSLGQIDKPEEVQEEIIEMLCHVDKVKVVISALKHAHPYEEPAIDIIPRLELK